MHTKLPKNIFVTGTDTAVGKTLASCILTLGLKAAYWKVIQSGIDTDTDWIQKYSQLADHHFFPESYKFKAPLSPHAASKIEGITIDIENIKVPDAKNFNHLIIEGCGGIMVPLNEKGDLLIDLMQKWKFSTIIVCRSSLGTINHSLLTIHHLRERGIPILGVIMNGDSNPSNSQAIQKYGGVRILGEIETYNTINKDALLKSFNTIINNISNITES